MTEITKQKAGKPQWRHVLRHLPNALEAMVRVREYGNAKYARIAVEAGVPFDPESWRTNPPDDYLDSAARHLVAVMRGERVNHEDGGVNHMAQAMIDLAFAFEIEHAQRQACPALQALYDAPLCDSDRPPSTQPSARAPQGLPLDRSYLWADGGAHLELLIRHPDQLPSLVTLVDAMARIKRWGGHCEAACSLARHCVNVARIARETAEPYDTMLVRSALCHDLAEALYGDIPTPRKALERAMLPAGVEHPNDMLTHAFEGHLEARYDLDLADPRIKQADLIANCVEAMQRNVGDTELAQWFSEDTRIAALAWARQHPSPAWEPSDDAAAWWRMWQQADGETPGVEE